MRECEEKLKNVQKNSRMCTQEEPRDWLVIGKSPNVAHV